MLLRIISAEWELYKGEIEKVSVPTDQWVLWILPWHMNIVSPLILGDISYIPSVLPTSVLDSFADHRHTISISWWLMMIEDDIITIATE